MRRAAEFGFDVRDEGNGRGLLGFWSASVVAACLVALALQVPSAGAAGVKTARAFGSCPELVDYAAGGFNHYVLPTMLPKPPVTTVGDTPTTVPMPAPVEAMSKDGAQGSPEHSTTNVQEAGIEEPDTVQNDGKRMFAVSEGRVYSVDLRAGLPRVVDSLPLDGVSGQRLLLYGNRLLAISERYPKQAGNPAGMADIQAGGGYDIETVVTQINVSDSASIEVVRKLRIEGSYLDARMTGGSLRIVTRSRPDALEGISYGDDALTMESKASKLAESKSADWLPSLKLTRKRSGKKLVRSLVRCNAVRHAADFSGLDMVTVSTIDLDRGLMPVDSDALMTNSEMVYQSHKALYVTSERWRSSGNYYDDQTVTAIHKFSTDASDRTSYRASGEVRGELHNEFALSEYKGNLRAATTDFDNRLQSFVTVLDDRDGKLVEVGRVGGIGRNEQIYGVRFIDDAAFVVTFRQTDPLYTIDLSDPNRPRVVGELKLLGYSAYLHPVGRDRLIGVGQDASSSGATRGTQVSLFDISDLRDPKRLANSEIGGHSEVEHDHHAFMYWPKTGLAVVPTYEQSVGLRIGRDRIDRVGEVKLGSDNQYQSSTRTVVADGRVYSVNSKGVAASSLQSLALIGWVPFRR